MDLFTRAQAKRSFRERARAKREMPPSLRRTINAFKRSRLRSEAGSVDRHRAHSRAWPAHRSRGSNLGRAERHSPRQRAAESTSACALRAAPHKNETPKPARGDTQPERAFLAQIPHTETKPEPRNGAVPCHFEAITHGSRLRLDWLAGAARFEAPDQNQATRNPWRIALDLTCCLNDPPAHIPRRCEARTGRIGR